MQLSNSLFLQTTFCVCIYVFLTLGSLTDAAGGARGALDIRTRAPASGSASGANGRAASQERQQTRSRSPSPPPSAHKAKILPFVLPSGIDTTGLFSFSTLKNVMLFKADAINFYKTKGKMVLEQIIAFVESWDVIAKHNPTYLGMVKKWQEIKELKGITPSGDQGVLSAALQLDELSFLDVVLGPGLVKKLGINYDHKLPAHDTVLSTPEMTKAFREIGNNGFTSDTQKIVKSGGATLKIEKDGFKISYTPMFDMNLVVTALEEPGALNSAWKGVSIKQIKSFFKAIREYETLRSHETIMTTLPNPKVKSDPMAFNIFKKFIPGTLFNIQLHPTKETKNGWRGVYFEMEPANSQKPFARHSFDKEKQILIKTLDVIASYGYPFYQTFEKLHSTLKAGSASLTYKAISVAVNAIKGNKMTSRTLKKLFQPFSILDQYRTFHSASFSLLRDNLKPKGIDSTHVYGDENFGIQLVVTGDHKISIRYQTILLHKNFDHSSPDYYLASLFESLDYYIIHSYARDFQRLVSQFKQIQASFSPPQDTLKNSRNSQRQSSQDEDNKVVSLRNKDKAGQGKSQNHNSQQGQSQGSGSKVRPRPMGFIPDQQPSQDSRSKARSGSTKRNSQQRQSQDGGSKARSGSTKRNSQQRQSQDGESEVQIRSKELTRGKLNQRRRGILIE